MKVAFFSSKSYDEEYFNQINKKYGHELQFFETRLDSHTIKLTKGFDAVCAFVNDKVDAKTLKGLSKRNIKLLTLRCAGFNNVDLEAAEKHGAGTVGYTQMEAKDTLIIGGRAGLIFNHFAAIGLAGYGFFNNLYGYNLPVGGQAWYSLAGGYNGIFIEPIVGATKPVHISFPVLLGMGGVGLVRNVGPRTWEDPFDIEMPENDFFFVVEPAGDLEFNLTQFFRLAATLSYRFTSNVVLTGKTPDVLQGWNFGLIFKLGKF